MASRPHTAISFLVWSSSELAPFQLEYPRLELGIGVLEFMGSFVEVLLELEILVGEFADHPFHVQDAAVGSLIGYRRRVDWVTDDNGNVSTTAFWAFSVSVASSHDEQEFG